MNQIKIITVKFIICFPFMMKSRLELDLDPYHLSTFIILRASTILIRAFTKSFCAKKKFPICCLSLCQFCSASYLPSVATPFSIILPHTKLVAMFIAQFGGILRSLRKTSSCKFGKEIVFFMFFKYFLCNFYSFFTIL